MLGCGFMKPCSDDETVTAIRPSSSKCDWNDARQRCEFEISPSRIPRARSVISAPGDVVVEREVMVLGPLVVDLAGDRVDGAGRSRPSAR